MLINEYRNKCVTADEAVKVIKNGDTGWNLPGAQATQAFLERRSPAEKEDLCDVNLRGGVVMKPLSFIENDPEGEHFTWNSMHMGGYERRLADKGLAYYIPIKYSEVPRYIRENCRTDVVAIQVAPMDEHGYFSFGVSISHYAAAIEKARVVIVEVNEDMPRVHGGYEHAVHISKLTISWRRAWRTASSSVR
jgi:acyl-CoA hydrolase